MCWSGEASIVLSSVGILSTAYAAYKKEPTVLWVCLGYFTLMEVLQAYTYSVIGQCSDPSNQVATLLGYLHIAFQPFFINAVSLHFINQQVARRISVGVYTVCFIATIMRLIEVYPFTWAGHCSPLIPMCAELLCSVHGTWHIAWDLPITGINAHFSWYIVAAFVLPLVYGSWRFTLYHILAGPLLAYATTQNMNEWPAVWCLFSIGFILIVIKTPIRKMLYVRHTWMDRFILDPNKH